MIIFLFTHSELITEGEKTLREQVMLVIIESGEETGLQI